MQLSFYKTLNLRNINKSVLNNSTGFILITLPFVLLILLGLIGLAIDAGRLYITQQELQASADAALRSAVGARVSEANGIFQAQEEQDYIRERIEASFFANISQRGILLDGERTIGSRILKNARDANFISFNNDVSTGVLSVSIEAVVDVSTMLIHILSIVDEFDTSRNLVRVRAQVQIQPANIVFIADLSESSACPETGPCLCNSPTLYDNDGNLLPPISCREEANAGGQLLRFERIREAFLNFLDGFDNRRDRISLVFFNNVAWTVVPFNPIGVGGIPRPGFSPDRFEEAFFSVYDKSETPVGNPNVIVPIGNTNISDALLESYRQAQEKGFIDNNVPITYILFTDGAPTATTIMPTHDRAFEQEVLIFGINWRCCDNNADYGRWRVPRDTISQWASPGMFIDYQRYKSEYINNPLFRLLGPLQPNLDNWDDPSPPFLTQEFIATCHINAGPHFAANVAFFPYDDGNSIERNRAVRRCMGDHWAYFLPCKAGLNPNHRVCPFYRKTDSLTESMFDPIFSTSSPYVNPSQYNNSYRKVFYLTSIEAANLMRGNNGTIYTLGWGNSLPVTNDPYQSILDEGNLKSVFLSNLANDFYGSHQIEPSGVARPLHPSFPEESMSYADKRRRGQAIGAFYEAPDAVGVQTSLNLIGREIRMKLLE